MTAELCPGGCGGNVRVHGRPGCPAFKPRRATWTRQVRRADAELSDFQRVYEQLAADVADHGIDALAVHDWPHGPGLLTQHVTIGEQLESLYRRVARWAQADGTVWDLALPLLAAILRRLRPGFVAPPQPTRTVTPPLAISLAIGRLTAAGVLPVTEDTLQQGGELGQDARLVWFWLCLLDEQVDDQDDEDD
jgi:hypothetical protein